MKKKIIDRLKEEYYIRYGFRINKNGKREPKRKTYYLEHLYDDLNRILDEELGVDEIMTERMAQMLSDSYKVNGNDPHEVYDYIYEILYTNEADEIKEFIFWLHDNDLSFGKFNYLELWKEFKDHN